MPPAGCNLYGGSLVGGACWLHGWSDKNEKENSLEMFYSEKTSDMLLCLTCYWQRTTHTNTCYNAHLWIDVCDTYAPISAAWSLRRKTFTRKNRCVSVFTRVCVCCHSTPRSNRPTCRRLFIHLKIFWETISPEVGFKDYFNQHSDQRWCEEPVFMPASAL